MQFSEELQHKSQEISCIEQQHPFYKYIHVLITLNIIGCCVNKLSQSLALKRFS